MSNLESEDLENVPLVRMEDVQPARDRNCVVYEELETCVVDSVDYEECVMENDEESHIGSMVSIEFEETIRCADSDSENDNSVELVVPEMLTQNEMPIKIELNTKTENLESWPTLEILPGGVIKHTVKAIETETPTEDCIENMYVCAKCSQSFKYLYSLVKHVKWHESEKKKSEFSKLCDNNKPNTCIHKIRSKVISKPNKRKAPKKSKS